MNHEGRPDAAGTEYFFGDQDVNLVDRIWLLAHYNDPDLYEGNYLHHYPFDINRVKDTFAKEPETPLYLRWFRSVAHNRPDETATAAIDSWSDGRVVQAQQLYQELTLTMLPLTLCVVYEHSSTHYWVLRRLRAETAYEYLVKVINYHTEELIPSFRWGDGATAQDKVNQFIAYTRKSLYPSRFRDKTVGVWFSELLGSGTSDWSDYDESEILEHVLYRYGAEPADGHTLEALELRDAIQTFRNGLDVGSQGKLDETLEQYEDNRLTPHKKLRRDTNLQYQLRTYLRQSGFRPQRQSPEPPKRQLRTLRAERGTERITWKEAVLAMLSVYSKRAYLLSPTQKAIVEAMADFHLNGHGFDTVIGQIAQELNSTSASVRTQFWQAKRILMLEEKNDGRRAYKERSRKTTIALQTLAEKIATGAEIEGLSGRDTQVVMFKMTHSSMSNTQIGEALGLGSDIIDKTLKKAADSVRLEIDGRRDKALGRI